MNLDRVGPVKDVPNDFSLIIEISSFSDPVKYEVDKATCAIFVDRSRQMGRVLGKQLGDRRGNQYRGRMLQYHPHQTLLLR